MRGVKYLYNARGKRTAVLIDLEESGDVWEDLFDVAMAREREAADDDLLAQLESSGVLRRPTVALPADWLRRRPAVKADVIAALLAEREYSRLPASARREGFEVP